VARAVQAAEAASAGLGAAVEGVERAASGEEPVSPLVLICGQGAAAELRRGMSMVSRLGSVLSELAYIIADATWEAEYEGDNSPVPEKLRDGIRTLAAAFKTMSEEEVNELLASISATAGVDSAVIMFAAAGADLERAAGEPFTEEQTTQLQAALDGFIARGFAPVLAEPDETDLQRQVTELTSGRDVLLRSVETLTGQMTELTERVQRFADAPAPPKTGGVLARAVDKAEDAAGGATDGAPASPTADDVQRVLSEMDPEERGLLLTRVALSRPLPVTR
jgi:methyl-accepting chemotaxis protein